MAARSVVLVPAGELGSLRRERFDTVVVAARATARTLELPSAVLQVVRGSYTGVWACGPQVVMNVDLEDLDIFEGLALLGLVAHEVGHIAAGHPHQRHRRPRRRRARLDREMEANRLAARAVGWEPLVEAYLVSVNRCVASRGDAPLAVDQVVGGDAWPYPEATDSAALLQRCAATTEAPGTPAAWN